MAELEAIATYFDRPLTAGEHEWLEGWLSESPDRIQAFVEWAALEYALDEHCESVHVFDHPDDEVFRQLMEQAARRNRLEHEQTSQAPEGSNHQHPANALRLLSQQDTIGSRLVVMFPKAALWGGLVAALLVIGVILWPTPPAPSNPTGGPIVGETVSKPEASLVRTTAAHWESRRQMVGQPLPLGRHHLLVGLIELEFGRGARVILEGPVAFEVLGDNRIGLVAGRLVADVPARAHGFTVQTPAAEIIDLGTSFGVEVADDGRTEAHVFEGAVRVDPQAGGHRTGQALALKAQQAAAVVPGQSSVQEIPIAADRFAHEMTLSVDLVDLLAGGDGTTRKINLGINPTNGEQVAREDLPRSPDQFRVEASGTYHPVLSNRFVDGVFIPSRDSRSLTVTSTGLTLSGLNEQMLTGYGLIWAGDFAPQPDREDISGDDTVQPLQRVFADSGSEIAQERMLVMHAPTGITFDLEAIREQHPGLSPGRFVSLLANAGAGVYGYEQDVQLRQRSGKDAVTRADCYVVVDGELRQSFRDIEAGSQPRLIEVELFAEDRFLTLVTTSGADQHNEYDWLLFGHPTIQLQAQPTNQP